MIGCLKEWDYEMFTGYGDVLNLDESEITVEEEDEVTALDQLEEEEEEEKKKWTQKELYDPEEIEPTELEELFPEAPYTVYYQDA